MSRPLMPEALRRIAAEYGLDDPPRQVVRADLDKKGRLVLECRGARWFRFDGERLDELRAERERALPLATWAREHPEGVRTLSWRPRRRIVLEVGSEILKGHRPKRLPGAARRHQLAQILCTSGEAPFEVPTLLGVDRTRAALRFEFVDGLPPRIRANEAPDFERIGLALRHFQEAGTHLTVGQLESLAHHTAEDEFAVVEERVRRAKVALGACPPGLEAALEDARRVTPEGIAPVPTHRDLHDRQILLGGGAPTLLDLDLLCVADPLLDVSNLLAHLALRRLQDPTDVPTSAVRACGDALLHGCHIERFDDHWRRLRSGQALALLRLAALYALRPRWSAVATDLVRLADRCLADVRSNLG